MKRCGWSREWYVHLCVMEAIMHPFLKKKTLPSLQSLMAISNQSQILFGGTWRKQYWHNCRCSQIIMTHFYLDLECESAWSSWQIGSVWKKQGKNVIFLLGLWISQGSLMPQAFWSILIRRTEVIFYSSSSLGFFAKIILNNNSGWLFLTTWAVKNGTVQNTILSLVLYRKLLRQWLGDLEAKG